MGRELTSCVKQFHRVFILPQINVNPSFKGGVSDPGTLMNTTLSLVPNKCEELVREKIFFSKSMVLIQFRPTYNI